MRIVVCPAAHLLDVCAEVRPALVLSLHGPGRNPPLLPDGVRRLAFAFHDIAEPRPGLVTPGRSSMTAILAAGRGCDGAVVVSCELGISRSTAAAYGLACQARPDADEAELALALRAASPCATPNALMIRIADALLGRDGRMVAAIAAIGRGADYSPYRAFALDAGPPASPARPAEKHGSV